jgi:hypothetical protein
VLQIFSLKMRRIHNIKSVDPEYTDECVYIRLNRSKTDSFRQGIIIPLYKTGYVICPVLALSIYLQLRQCLKSLDSDAFFFVSDNKKPLIRHCYYTY